MKYVTSLQLTETIRNGPRGQLAALHVVMASKPERDYVTRHHQKMEAEHALSKA